MIKRNAAYTCTNAYFISPIEVKCNKRFGAFLRRKRLPLNLHQSTFLLCFSCFPCRDPVNREDNSIRKGQKKPILIISHRLPEHWRESPVFPLANL